MYIFFEHEMDDNVEQPLQPDNLVFEGLRNFIYTRFKVLETEIDNLTTPQKPAAAIICMQDEGIGIKYLHIPEYLQEKLNNCINDSDWEYIINVLWNKIQSLNKGH